MTALAVNKPGHIESLDLLRGFAAISVVVYHAIAHLDWKSFPVDGPLLWFRVGWLGVDLFFVISGLVIGLSAFDEIARSGNQGFRKPFMQRRLARIVPLHYLTLALFIAFVMPQLLVSSRLLPNLLTHLAFVHNFFPGFHGAINGSNWSIGTEMQFYVLVALLAPWLRAVSPLKLTVACLAVAWSWRLGVTMLVAPSPVSGPFPIFVAATQLPGMLDEFLVGLLLARLLRSGRNYGMHNATTGVLLTAVLTGLLVYISWAIYWKNAVFWNNPWMVVFFRTAVAISAGALVYLFCLIHLNRWTRGLLSPFLYLGTISYGIYLWHLPVMLSIKNIGGLSNHQYLLLTMLVTCALAALSYHFFERPIMRYGFKAYVMGAQKMPAERRVATLSSS